MTIQEVYGCEPEKLVCPHGYEFTDHFRCGVPDDWVLGNNGKHNGAEKNQALKVGKCEVGVEPRLILRKVL